MSDDDVTNFRRINLCPDQRTARRTGRRRWDNPAVQPKRPAGSRVEKLSTVTGIDENPPLPRMLNGQKRSVNFNESPSSSIDQTEELPTIATVEESNLHNSRQTVQTRLKPHAKDRAHPNNFLQFRQILAFKIYRHLTRCSPVAEGKSRSGRTSRKEGRGLHSWTCHGSLSGVFKKILKFFAKLMDANYHRIHEPDF